ncbi:MAG: TIGR01777 family protein [Bacteroidetes bacterium]|nr:TIGR01777 family protein [Bacteroidota bacterium]
MKKIVIAGGSGFLGQALSLHFKNEFDEIIILSRQKNKQNGNIKYLQWDAKTFGDWCAELEGAEAVINLCGKSVDCRYTEKNRKEILASRIDSTKIIGDAIAKCTEPPKLWLNGASATIYRNSLDTPMSESSGEIGSGFSVDVCKAWEKVFDDLKLSNTRKIDLRISLVFGTTGGVLPTLLNVVKKGIGGKMGSGKQQVSWIHINDFCRMISWLIENKTSNGIYNVVAPEPVTNASLMSLLRKKAGVSIGLPATAWMLEIGAFFIRTETELILKSRYIVPERLMKEGFKFRFNTIEDCISAFEKF